MMLKPCGVITLLTDFGLNDPFVGIMKGVIYNINPQAKIVDLTHNIESYSIRQAALILLASYKYFSKGTIHVVVVDPGVGGKRKAIAIETTNYYFIGPDNGVLLPAAKDDGIVKIINLSNKTFFLNPVSYTFHGRDIFAPCAAYLSLGINIDTFGERLNIGDVEDLSLNIIDKYSDHIVAEVIHIDKFGNLVLNVRGEVLLNRVKFGDLVQLNVHGKEVSVKFVRTFSEVSKHSPCLYIDSFGLLELGVNMGNAREFFKLNIGDKICLRIKH